jgi:hypothetical protein
MGDVPESKAARSADAALIVKLGAVRDFAEAIGADDIVTPKEFAFLKQKISDMIALEEGDSIDVLARHAIRLFAPQARPEAMATMQLRLAKLAPSIEAVTIDGVISLQELEFLKRKVVELNILRQNESPEQLLRVALKPVLDRVKLHPAVQALLYGGKSPGVGPIAVVVTPDGREARAIVEKGQRWGAEEVARALTEARVTHGIDKRWVEARTPVVQPGQTVVLARGVDPGVGAPSAVTWHVLTQSKVEVEPVNWREPVRYETDTAAIPYLVKRGALLATLTAPGVGEAGITVRGEPIPGKVGSTNVLFGGLGVATENDGLAFHAAHDGALVVTDGNVVSVKPVLEVKRGAGPVVVHHDGAVVVHGDVAPGSRIVATGDVRIDGALEGAEVLSGGSVLVREGVFRKGFVRAAGDAVVRRLESEARLEVGGNVFLRADAMNATIDAGAIVSAIGSIIGCTVRARTSVEADAITLGRATETRIEVHGGAAGTPVAELRSRLVDLERHVARARGVLASTAAEAGAVKTLAAVAAPARSAPLPGASAAGPHALPHAPPAPARGSAHMRVAAPAAPAAPGRVAAAPVENVPRTPPLTLGYFTGEDLPPVTTAAAIRIEVDEAAALEATVDAAFVRARVGLTALPERTPFPARALVRTSFASGVRVVVEGNPHMNKEDRGPGAFLFVDGEVRHHPRPDPLSRP